MLNKKGRVRQKCQSIISGMVLIKERSDKNIAVLKSVTSRNGKMVKVKLIKQC